MRSIIPHDVVSEPRASPSHKHAHACELAGDRMMASLDRLKAIVAARKFETDQPRAPAGNPNGGQWIGGETGGSAGVLSIEAIASSGGEALAAACEAQFDRDIFQCRMVGLRSCYEQAYQRYAACLARQQIPPFNY